MLYPLSYRRIYINIQFFMHSREPNYGHLGGERSILLSYRRIYKVIRFFMHSRRENPSCLGGIVLVPGL